MKKILVTLAFLPLLAFAQTENSKTIVVEKVSANDETEVVVENPAEYPGGMKELYSFLSKEIIYPKEIANQNIQGKVFVQFVIEKDGSITNATVLNKGKTNQPLEDEAVRVISKMPKWKPASNKGEIVRSYYTLPINFTLNDKVDDVEKK